MTIRWTPELSVGVEKIDNQHQELFLLVNQLMEACKRGLGHDELRPVLVILKQQMLVHFADEEALMQQSAYPGAELHILEHAMFQARLQDLEQTLAWDGPQPALIAAVNQSIDNWLCDHVVLEDKTLGRFLRTQG